MQNSDGLSLPIKRIEPTFTELDGYIMQSAKVYAEDADGNEFLAQRVPAQSTGKTKEEFVQDALEKRAKLREDTLKALEDQLAEVDAKIEEFGTTEQKATRDTDKAKDTFLNEAPKR